MRIFSFNLIFLIFVSSLSFSDCPTSFENEMLFVVPIVANSSGAYNSKWVSDLYIKNYANFEQFAYIYFAENGKEFSYSNCFEEAIREKSSVYFENVLENLFQIENSSGHLIIVQYSMPEAYIPFQIFSKTYDENKKGENLPQIVPVYFMDKHPNLKDRCGYTIGLLPGNQNFRTNIGFVNISNFEIEISIFLAKKDGNEIGEKEVKILPYGHLQINQVLKEFTNEEIDEFYISIGALTEGAKYFAYVSMINNQDNQAVFIPFQ